MVSMLLQLPQPLPHAVPREPVYDFYSPSHSAPRLDTARQMLLPIPRLNPGHDLPAFRTAAPPPFTPPTEYSPGWQLPSIARSANFSRSLTCSLTTSQSPTPQRQSYTPSQDMSQQSPRKLTLASNLMIPPSIKTPQDGLAHLAAEVTCLFWFENSSTLEQALDADSPRLPARPLVSDALPSMNFKKWVATILATTAVAQNVIILALLFIYRLKTDNPRVKGKPGSEYRLLAVALMLGNKFLDDNTYTNKTWAEVSGISAKEVRVMEVEFLSNMRYGLFTSEKQWDEWHVKLGKFGTFFDRAAQVTTSPGASFSPPTSSTHRVPAQLIAPPPTQLTSTPVTVAYSPCYSQLSYTPSLPPQASSRVVSPTGFQPELGPLTHRKRSADNTAEPPAKRLAHGYPGTYSSTRLIPSLQVPNKYESPHSMNRLPSLPSLLIPNPQHLPPVQVNSWPELPLPAAGGRSIMSIVYPPPNQYRLQYVTPTSTAPPSYPSVHTINVDDTSRHGSPYPLSAGSSPTSATLPSNQRQLSPQYIIRQRQSPYRPVCGVEQLAAPPPSTSMHNIPRIAHDQMQYHPLGRPMTERRYGPVPYTDYRAWPETQHYTQLPPPHAPIFNR